MPIGDDTHATRRHLPHLQKAERNYYVTFCTHHRRRLSEAERSTVLQTAIDLHRMFCWLHVITVMPDHVHAILQPLGLSFSGVMKRLKGRSSLNANRAMGRSGRLWQAEFFDRILRSDENLTEKMDYICNNPVRAGIVAAWREYRWTWRACDHVTD